MPWNKGKLLGQKPPLKRKEIWAIRIRLQLDHRTRELALFNLAIDSKLRGCDLVGLRVHDVVQGSQVARRAIVMQRKTQRPVQFELTEQTRNAVATWIAAGHLKSGQYLFPSRMSESPHVSTRQHSRIVVGWVGAIGLDPATYGTHSLRTKATRPARTALLSIQQAVRLSRPMAKRFRVTRMICCSAGRGSSIQHRAVTETDRSKLRPEKGRDSALPTQYGSFRAPCARATSSHEALGSSPTARRPASPAMRRVS